MIWECYAMAAKSAKWKPVVLSKIQQKMEVRVINDKADSILSGRCP